MFTPVRPFPSHVDVITVISHKQVDLMTRGKACPTCMDGIPDWGAAVCSRCEDETDRDRIAREVATVRAALVEDEMRTLGRLHVWRRG